MGLGLFYTGIALMSGALLAAGVAFFAFRVWRARLKAKLDEEYGETPKQP